MKTVLPGAPIGLLGGGGNSRMLALAAYRMGYRVHVYSEPGDTVANPLADVSIHAAYEDLDRIREFAVAVEVVTVAATGVPMLALRAAAAAVAVCPSPEVFDAIEDSDTGGIGAKRSTAAPLADFSVIGARGANGDCAFYPPIAIDRSDNADAVDIARCPAPIPSKIVRQAAALTRDMLEDLDITGLACVEFTLTQEGELVLHEVTPHSHPSGHLTVDACVTSQFEQQLRAVCGLPLGSTQMLRPAAMAVLSDVAVAPAYEFPQVKVYSYGSRGGHLTATARSATLAKQIVLAARSLTQRASLTPNPDV